MSTRCTTHFIDSTYIDPATNKPHLSAIIYRHSDGYPKVAGVDLYKFLRACKKLKDTRLDHNAFLAARYVSFLGDIFNKTWAGQKWKRNKTRLDFISVGVMMKDPLDIEYRYVVDCGKMSNGLPEVRCYNVSVADNGTDDSCVEVHIPGTPNAKLTLGQPKLAKRPFVVIPASTMELADTEYYTNRFLVRSSHGTIATDTDDDTRSYMMYTIGQHKTSHIWQCTCMAHRVHGRCKHIQALGLPDYAVEVIKAVNL